MSQDQKERLKNIGYALRLSRLHEERALQMGPGGLMHFIRYMWKTLEPGRQFVDGWALGAIAEHLEAVERGELPRLLVTVPPGFMKSLMINVFFMCWLWGPQNKPHLRSLSFSYAAHLTERDNEKCRTLINSRPYQELWGDRFKLANDSKIKISNDHQGWLLASSVGGISTGERGDIIRCLEKNELILTSKGWLSVGEIVENRLPVKIAGLNHETNCIEWQEIEEYEKNDGSELVEMSWEGGSLLCTPEHPIFIHARGYTPASEVREGEFALRTRRSFFVSELQQRDSPQTKSPSEVLQPIMPRCGSEEAILGTEQQALYDLRRAYLSNASALEEAFEWRPVLQPQMPWGMECRPEQSSLGWRPGHKRVQVVRETVPLQQSRGSAKDTGLLFTFLRQKTGLGRKKIGAASLRLLQAILSTTYKKAEILLSPLHRRVPWAQDFRKKQWPLHSRASEKSISTGVDQDAKKRGKRTRWESLPSLQKGTGEESELGCASYRLQQGKYPTAKLNNPVSLVPWENAREHSIAPLLEGAIIRSIKKLPERPISVYNLRVFPHHNYFVNGILTHNCDDPHNAIQGESERVRNETVRWFKESMSNRLNDMENSSIIVVHQRLHESDVAGSIIEDPQGMGYEHLCIPMRFEIDGPWSNSTSIGWKDPRTEDGELAWPQRFSAKVCDNLERDLGPWGWSSQYQQNPAPRGGGIIKRNWFRLWENPQNKFPPFENIIAAVDPAYTEKDENDPSAMAIFATFRHPETNEFGIMLVHCWRKRLQIHGDTSPRFPGESVKSYERRCGDNWGLVEWIWHCCDAYGVQQLFIEGKASGLSVFQEIERRQSLRPWSCDIDTGRAGGDKTSRLTAVQPMFSQGLVWAPDRDWADMFIQELCNFPKGKYDDLCDCASLGLRKMREMGLIQHTDEREYEEYTEQSRPQALQPLYPV